MEKFKFNIKKFSTISVIAFLFLLTISFFLIMGYLSITIAKVNFEEQRSHLITAEIDYLNTIINNTSDKSAKLAESIKSEIIEQINEYYADDKQLLQLDLNTLGTSNDTKLIEILGNSISDKYVDNIQNDNNDPFIMTQTQIVSDLSFNCSVDDSRVRTLEEEINLHFNKNLADKALRAITLQENRLIFWSFLEPEKNAPWYNDIKDMEYVSLYALEELIIKYNGDYRILESLEFLTPVYIYNKEDLLGNKLISYSGYKQPNHQLIVVSGFNLIDVINVNYDYKNSLNNYRVKIDLLYHDYMNDRNVKILLFILEFILFLIVLMSISKLQYNYIKDNYYKRVNLANGGGGGRRITD